MNRYIFRLFLMSVLLFTAQSIKSQSISIKGQYIEYDYSISGYGEPTTYPATLHLSALQYGGWTIGFDIDAPKKGFFYTPPEDIPEGKISFPLEETLREVSEKELKLTNKEGQYIRIYIESIFLSSDLTITCDIHLSEEWFYQLHYIELPSEETNVTDYFKWLVKQISKPYTVKSATCDTSLIGLINNPLGIEWGDSWLNTFNEFIPVAERFYGSYNHSLGYFKLQEFNFYLKALRTRFTLQILGQQVSSIYLDYGYNNDNSRYIKSTTYDIELSTPKQYKKNPNFNDINHCIWTKESALKYFNQVRDELIRLGCTLKEEKSKAICRYEGALNGKMISISLQKITGKYSDCFFVSLSIAQNT